MKIIKTVPARGPTTIAAAQDYDRIGCPQCGETLSYVENVSVERTREVATFDRDGFLLTQDDFEDDTQHAEFDEIRCDNGCDVWFDLEWTSQEYVYDPSAIFIELDQFVWAQVCTCSDGQAGRHLHDLRHKWQLWTLGQDGGPHKQFKPPDAT